MHSDHTAHMSASPSWVDMWSPGLALLLVVLAVLYLYATGPWRSRFADSEPVRLKEKLYMLLGLAFVYTANGSPLAYYAHHYMFSAHMLQQSFLYLIAPPLIWLGLPGWLIRPLFRTRAADFAMRIWTQPLVAIFVFNLVFSFYHIPLIMNALMESQTLHTWYNVVFLISAFQMWSPLFGSLPEYNQMSGLKKVAYIFVNGILLTPACALIIFADDVLYNMYANVPAQYTFFEPIQDQQLGGVIMKIVQEIVYVFALAHCFFRWYRLERKQDDEEEIVPNEEIILQRSGNWNQA